MIGYENDAKYTQFNQVECNWIGLAFNSQGAPSPMDVFALETL